MPRVTSHQELTPEESRDLKAIGQHLLSENKGKSGHMVVAAILMCAGSSSRFDGEDKFLHPIRLSSKTTLLDLVFRRLRRQAGGKSSMAILINCNEGNMERIQEYLKRKQYYGFSPHKIR